MSHGLYTSWVRHEGVAYSTRTRGIKSFGLAPLLLPLPRDPYPELSLIQSSVKWTLASLDFRNDEDEDVIEDDEEELREMLPNIRDPEPFSVHRPDSEDFPWEDFFPEFDFSARRK